VRDLAQWCVQLALQPRPAALLDAKVAPWSGLPLWIPEADPDFGGMLLASGQRAIDAGLHTRSWLETARDTLAWAREAGASAHSASALTPEAEAEILVNLGLRSAIVG